MTHTLQHVLRQYGFPKLVHPNARTNQLHVTDKTPSGRLPASFSGVSNMRSGNYLGGRLGMVVPEGLGRISQREHDLAEVTRGMAAFHGLSGLGDTKFLDVSVTPTNKFDASAQTNPSAWTSQNTSAAITAGAGLISNIIGAFTTSKSSTDGGASAAAQAELARAAQERAVWEAQMRQNQAQLDAERARLQAQASAPAATAEDPMKKYLLIGGAVVGGILLLKLLK